MFRKIIVSLLIILTITFSIIVGGLYYYMNKINRTDVKGIKEPTISHEAVVENDLKIATNSLGISDDLQKEVKQDSRKKQIKNILLLGIDSNDGVGRSDAMIILSVNPNDKKLKLSSLLRDSKVYIAGQDKDKLNHAYAYGGEDLSLWTVNANFDLNIEDYVLVDFSSLKTIVDEVGGIDINLTFEEAESLGLNEGMNTLDGEKVLSYSRIRSTDGGDYTRTSRQRTVIDALIKKTMNQKPQELVATIDKLLPHMKTSLKNSEIIDLGLKVSRSKYILEQDYFPNISEADGKIESDNVFYIDFDKKKVKERLHNFIFE